MDIYRILSTSLINREIREPLTNSKKKNNSNHLVKQNTRNDPYT